MAHRTVLFQSAVLPRLLAAIGAGSFLATAGCGGATKSTSPSGEVSNGVGGNEQATGSWEDSSTPPADTGSRSETSTRAAANSSEVSASTATTASEGSSQGRTIESTLPDASAPYTGETSEGGASTASTHEGSSSTEPGMCEYGSPQRFCVNVEQMEQQARYGVGQIALDPPRSDEEIADGWDDNRCMKPEWIATSCCNPALGPGEPQGDGTCCYVACEGACCGRPFMVNGVAIVARSTETADWLLPPSVGHGDARELGSLDVVLDERARRILSEVWLQDAMMEHASVASFSRFSLDLLQLGAPPELVRDSQLAALDEIEHARIAFSIAQQLSGVKLGPDRLPMGDLSAHSLREAIAAAIVEGCIGETLAAGVLAEQASRCLDQRIAKHLRQISEDELRHSELAWRFVAWSIERFGHSARVVAEETFVAALSQTPQAPDSICLTSEQLHAAGRLSTDEWHRTVHTLMTTVLQPAAATLLRGAVESATAYSPDVSTITRTV